MARDEPVEMDNVSVLILNASKVEETEALPEISNLVVGEDIPMPTLAPTIFKVLAVAVPLTTKALLAPAVKPLATDSEPAKELEAVPEDTNSFDMVRSPIKEWEAEVSAMKRPDI